VKRIAILVILALMLSGLVLSNITDTAASIADTSIPDNEITTSASEQAIPVQVLQSRLGCILCLMSSITKDLDRVIT